MESGSSRKSADFRWTGSFPSAGGAGVSTQNLGKPPSAVWPRRHGMSLPQADGVGVTSTILRRYERPCNRSQAPKRAPFGYPNIKLAIEYHCAHHSQIGAVPSLFL